MASSGSSVAGNVLFFFTDGFLGQAQSLFLAFGAFFFTGRSDAASVGVGGGSGGILSEGVSGGRGGISEAGPRLVKIFSSILLECQVVESSLLQ